jgi:hypothetical protein
MLIMCMAYYLGLYFSLSNIMYNERVQKVKTKVELFTPKLLIIDGQQILRKSGRIFHQYIFSLT